MSQKIAQNFVTAICLQVPQQGDPSTWVVGGIEDLFNRCDRAYSGDLKIYDKCTVEDLANEFGIRATDPEEKFIEEDLVWVLDLAKQHGWKTDVYRADFLNSGSEYSSVPVDKLEAYVAYCGHDLDSFYLVKSEEEFNALYSELTGPNAPRIGKCGPRQAAAKLMEAAITIGWADEPSDDNDLDDASIPAAAL